MKPSPATLHTLRRLVTGREVDPTKLPDGPFRRIAERLQRAPLENRNMLLLAFLDSQEESEVIGVELAAIDPDTAPPEDTAAGEETADEWGPIWLDDPPGVEPFPIDILPPAARHLATEAALSVGCPLDFPATACLAVAAGVIGRSVVIHLKGRYETTASLWIAVVGQPSDGKSPGIGLVYQGIGAIVEELQDQHDEEMKEWREEKGKPTPPSPGRIAVDDATGEALVRILADNPRGLLQFKDELVEFLHGMDQYKAGNKGSDRPRYCKIWAGKEATADRAKHEANIPIRVAHPCLTLFGALVPDHLSSLVAARGAADGFLERFLLSFPPAMPVPDWRDEGIDDDVADAWRNLLDRLWSRKLIEVPSLKAGAKPRKVPHVAHLTDESRAAWREGHRRHVAEMNGPDFPTHLRGPWGKLKEYAGRLALVLTLMHHAAHPYRAAKEVPEVPPERVRDAWRLVNYFKSHARKVYSRLGENRPAESATTTYILSWIDQRRPATFTARDLKHSRPSLVQEEVESSLRLLTRKNLIRVVRLPDARPKGGRPTRKYEVNPLFSLPGRQNVQNRQKPEQTEADPDFHAASGFQAFPDS